MSEVFKASRWTKGNHLFRTVIEVGDQSVVPASGAGSP